MRNLVTLVVGVMCAAVAFAAEDTGTGLKWGGDFRYRFESVRQETEVPGAYHQHRIRARVGATAHVHETAKFEFRLATGPGRVSTNQTLGQSSASSSTANAFANYAISLDRAFVVWTPLKQVSLAGGRYANLFFLPIGSDLVWDLDLNFDGLALGLRADPVESFGVFLNSTINWVDKNTTGGNDVLLSSIQLGATHELDTDLSWSFAGAIHHYSSLQGHVGLASPTSTNGNTSIASGSNRLYAVSFNIVDLGLELKAKVTDIPVAVGGEYVINGAAATENAGFLTGFRVGKSSAPGDWLIAYDFRRLSPDAVVGAFTDGDSAGGGTNIESHRIGAAYVPAEHWVTAATFYTGTAGIAAGQTGEGRMKLQLDVNYRF